MVADTRRHEVGAAGAHIDSLDCDAIAGFLRFASRSRLSCFLIQSEDVENVHFVVVRHVGSINVLLVF